MGTVTDAVAHLELALKMLDEAGEYHAAAFVASALDALQPLPFPDDSECG